MKKESVFIKFLYKTIVGRKLLKIVVQPGISKKVGNYLNSKYSRWIIPIFVHRYKIDLSEYKKMNFQSFNDFFTRQKKTDQIDITPEHFISPCDGYLSVYPIRKNQCYNIKNVEYNVGQLLKNQELAQRFEDGYCMIFRLTPQNYHRYCYISNGTRISNKKINGKLHTVKPIAYSTIPVFIENSREYVEIDSDYWGNIVQMEIGALLVGKIHNYLGKNTVQKGEEKGYFEFGGSTIIVLTEKDKVCISQEIIENSAQNIETQVFMGKKNWKCMERGFDEK